MRDDIKRQVKLISNTLMEYYLEYDAKNISMKFNFDKHLFSISIKGSIQVNSKEILNLKEKLNSRKSSNVELYYLELLDNPDCRSVDFSLLSSIIDKANINYNDSILSIDIVKNF